MDELKDKFRIEFEEIKVKKELVQFYDKNKVANKYAPAKKIVTKFVAIQAESAIASLRRTNSDGSQSLEYNNDESEGEGSEEGSGEGSGDDEEEEEEPDFVDLVGDSSDEDDTVDHTPANQVIKEEKHDA